MAQLDSIIARALDYRLTWCENHHAERYYSEWRVDPCLVIVYASGDRHRLFVNTGEEEKCFDALHGEALLIPAGVRHRFESEEGQIRGVNVQYTLFGSVDVLSFYRVPHYLDATSAQQVGDIIASLVSVAGRRSALLPLTSRDVNAPLNFSAIIKERCLVFDLLAAVLDQSQEIPEGGKRLLVMQKLRPALEYIEDNLERKIVVDDLAVLCGLSAHRFSNIFKEITGQPPHHYILSKRIDKAMDLLTRTDNSIADIARMLGFHDQPHFTKLFKNTTGLSPNYYRKDVRRSIYPLVA